MIPYLEECTYFVHTTDGYGYTTIKEISCLRDLKAYVLSESRYSESNSPKSILYNRFLFINLFELCNLEKEDHLMGLVPKRCFFGEFRVYDQFGRLVNHSGLLGEIIEVASRHWNRLAGEGRESIRILDTSKFEWRKYMHIENLPILKDGHYFRGYGGVYIRRGSCAITPRITSNHVMNNNPQFEIMIRNSKVIHRKTPVPGTRYKRHRRRNFHRSRGILREVASEFPRRKRIADFREIFDSFLYRKVFCNRSWKNNLKRASKNWDREIGQPKEFHDRFVKKREKNFRSSSEIEKPTPDCYDLFDSNLTFEF